MAYQVLARKYRPLRFSDVVGQDHVTRTLLNALAQSRIAHGYIFSGHRGIGKTTIARILASALNCRNPIGSDARSTPEPCNACESCLEIRSGNAVDVIEIDAATNRGIDEIRELRDAARYRPSRDRFKIYILDEAHQITDAAFNALLKTLEEPPEHIVFMMATTQPEDIPQTIRSRCQHFSFHAVKLDDIMGQLRAVSFQETIQVDDATLALLAEAGDGSMRDALSIMDQAIASAPLVDGRPLLQIDQIRELMGSVSNVVYEEILNGVHANSSASVLSTINRLLDAGNGAPQLARQFVRYLRNCTVAKITQLSPDAEATGLAADLLQISPEERSRVARSATLFTEEELSRFLAIMLRTFDELGYRQEQHFHLELGLLKLVHAQRLLPIEDLLSQLGAPAKPGTASTTTRPPVASSSLPAKAGSLAGNGASVPRSPAATAVPSRPSPFETDSSRKSPTGSTAIQSEGAKPATEGALALAPAVSAPPRAQPEVVPSSSERPHLIAPPAEPAAVLAEVFSQASGNSAPVHVSLNTTARIGIVEQLQAAFISALGSVKGQETASEQIEDATLVPNCDTLDIQTTVSKTMLPFVINAEAERILLRTLQGSSLGLTRLRLLPGTLENASTATANPGATKPKAPRSGSAAELAEKHPLVQQARQLFSAEISNVIDLRDKN